MNRKNEDAIYLLNMQYNVSNSIFIHLENLDDFHCYM